jgi:hypothetical protein
MPAVFHLLPPITTYSSSALCLGRLAFVDHISGILESLASILVQTTGMLASKRSEKEKNDVRVFISLDPFLQGIIGLVLSINTRLLILAKRLILLAFLFFLDSSNCYFLHFIRPYRK